MKHFLLVFAAFVGAAASAHAHFVFVVPSTDGKSAVIVLSEELAPDEAVGMENVKGLKLVVRDAEGRDVNVDPRPGKHALDVDLPGTGPRVVFGSVVFGVRQRGESKPFLLEYHPKVLIGAVSTRTIGEKLPAELIPIDSGGQMRIQLMADGKPVSAADVTILKPDGEKVKLKTDAKGQTEPIEGTGRFGAWSRVTVATAGESGGKKYEEVRHYPTLVFEKAAPAHPPLPMAVSSLGAIECEGYLYIYGGHAAKTHHYDTKSVLGTFHRLKLNGGTKWEELPGGPILQGMNLAAHGGKVYRVGGMQPRNAPGEPADTHSVPDVAVFDPKTGNWDSLPPLPAARSSHDVVISGNKLVVVGGWDQRGRGNKPVWHETTLILDLRAPKPEWKTISQPFRRRALTAAAIGSRVYVLGGFSESGTDRRVDVLDVNSEKWTRGPTLPGADRGAFAPAAGIVNGRVVVNTIEGPVYRLTASGDGWEKAATAAHRRMVARLIPSGPNRIVLVGGANGSRNVADVESVSLSEIGEPVSARE